VSEIIVYASFADANQIREWLNNEPYIAWLVKHDQQGRRYSWRAVQSVDGIGEGSYALWHTEAMRLTIPSGSPSISDTPVLDPYRGWTQTLDSEHADTPWFGGNLPGPVFFTWREKGCESPDSLGRSGFSWLGNRYASIGKPAAPIAARWWQRLKRYVATAAVPIPWPYGQKIGRLNAYAFPEALTHIRGGRHPDMNPWFSRAT
jgi:hypothetical protein